MKLVFKSHVGNWERFEQRKNSEKFKRLRADILQRDAFICQFCSHMSQELTVINADNQYRNNSPDNLVSACELCAQVTLLDQYRIDYAGQDRIIYFPELLQEQINQLCRVLFCKMKEEGGESAYNAKKIFAQLQDRAAWLDQKAGCKLSSPGLFNLYLCQKNKDQTLIQHLRWLPNFEGYQQNALRWKDEISVMADEDSNTSANFN